MDWAEDKALRGRNLSADSVAGIAGASYRRSAFFNSNLGTNALNPNFGSYDFRLTYRGDRVPGQLRGHFRWPTTGGFQACQRKVRMSPSCAK